MVNVLIRALTLTRSVFAAGLWGGWSFQVQEQDTATRSLLFSHGGYQEARGAGGGKHYYIENVLEVGARFVRQFVLGFLHTTQTRLSSLVFPTNQELDAPGEWFYDPVSSKLHFWPNSTDGSPGKEIVAPLLSAIVRVEGAKDVSFEGFTFTETRATFMEQYEVPSGGEPTLCRSRLSPSH
eukprot:SAG31_NODE_5585_length_2442_cov_1.305164_2_plen_181_part_00